MKVSIIIPAWNEQARIGNTLQALSTMSMHLQLDREIIVVDDGSHDQTATLAAELADRVIRLTYNRGKGHALRAGVDAAVGEVVMFIDADLSESAEHADQLLLPVLEGRCDMTIAKLPSPTHTKGGFGLVRGLAGYGIARLGGIAVTAPLSGQRAIRRQCLEQLSHWPPDYGIEVGLTIGLARRGFRIEEVEVPFSHRETGRDWQGWRHRGKQFIDVGRALLRCAVKRYG